MHIPPYFKKPNWQRFFAGMFIGGIVAFAVFLFMYGTHVENWIDENMKLRTQITTLEDQLKSLNQDNQKLNEKQNNQYVVKSIEIEFINEQKMLENRYIDRLGLYKLRELAKQQLPDLIGKEIKALAENSSLLYSAIEGKIYKIDEFSYELSVKRLLFSDKLKISVVIIVSKN